MEEKVAITDIYEEAYHKEDRKGLVPRYLSVFRDCEHIQCNILYHLPKGVCKIPTMTLHPHHLTPIAALPLWQMGPCRVHSAATEFRYSSFCTLPEGFILPPEIAVGVGWVSPHPNTQLGIPDFTGEFHRIPTFSQSQMKHVYRKFLINCHSYYHNTRLLIFFFLIFRDTLYWVCERSLY